MPNPMDEAVIKRELRQMETRLENYCNQRLEQWENRKRLASSNNQSDTQHALDLQALQALRNELEESTRRQIKQTESRLEQYCNQRFEQMETKVNERLQQIRSSLEEFLIIAESEGIYPAPMEGSSSNHPTGTVGKGRNYG
jgi:septal ring factor EnvC (AmiA/AmiB activator)